MKMRKWLFNLLVHVSQKNITTSINKLFSLNSDYFTSTKSGSTYLLQVTITRKEDDEVCIFSEIRIL